MGFMCVCVRMLEGMLEAWELTIYGSYSFGFFADAFFLGSDLRTLIDFVIPKAASLGTS